MYTTRVWHPNWSHKWLVCAVVLAFVLVGTESRASRIWTSRDGRQVEAELIEVEDEQVTLRREDGKQFTIPISGLSTDDIKYLRGLESQATVALPMEDTLDLEPNATGTSGSETRFHPMQIPPMPAITAAAVGVVALALLLVCLRRLRPLLGLIGCLSIGGFLGLTASLGIASYRGSLSRPEDVYEYAVQSQSWSMSSLVDAIQSLESEGAGSTRIPTDELLKPLAMTLVGIASGLVLFVLSRLGQVRPKVGNGRIHQIRCPNVDCQSLIPATADVCFECGRHLETGQPVKEPRFLDVPHRKAGVLRYRFRNQVLEVQRVRQGRPFGHIERSAVSQYTVLEVHHIETKGQWAWRQLLFWPTWLAISILIKMVTLGFAPALVPFGAGSRQRDTIVLRMEADSDIGATRIVFPNVELMRSFVKLARRFMDVEIIYFH